MVNGTVLNLTCTVSRIKPQAMIYWMVDGRRENRSESVTTNEDGTFKQTNTIRYLHGHLEYIIQYASILIINLLNTTDHISFSVTDEDDTRCIVDPVYGDTIEAERPTTHLRKYNKIRPETIADCHAIETHVVQPSLLKMFLFPVVLTKILALS